MTPLAVQNVGVVCGVGLNAETSCAAIRSGINNFQETRFLGADGAWLIGSPVEPGDGSRGVDRLAKLAARAIGECVADTAAAKIPLLLCIAEPERPGRPENLPHALAAGLAGELGCNLHADSLVIQQGRVGGAMALAQARRLLDSGQSQVIVAGIDSYLSAPTLAALDRADRLLRRNNSNGFIPGEAAAACLIARNDAEAPLLVRGVGFAREPAPYGSGQPLLADGLTQAIKVALDDAGIALHDCDHRIADLNGESWRFKEAALAITRLLRERKVLFSVWQLADCIGEVGAATLPAMLAVLYFGALKDYLPGQTFVGHLSNDDDRRAAFIAKATLGQTLALEAGAEARFSLRRRERA